MFEGMLAKKYIGAQKRHSALTVCSIVIALALILMLFTLFSTGINILRNIAYSNGEYHILVSGVNNKSPAIDKEKLDAVVEAVGEYGTCTIEELDLIGEGTFYRIYIMLDKRIDSAYLFMNRVAGEIGVEKMDYLTNDMLILLDVKDAQAGFRMSQIIAMFYVFILFLILMLRLIIDTAFEISSKERERQFGVLQSIGATPKQIVRIITYEGLMLSVIGIPIGVGAGIGLAYLVYRGVLGTELADLYLSPERAAELVHFTVNPWLTLLGTVTGAVWVLLSAYGTGMRVIRMSPVQAISRRTNTVKKVGKAAVFGRLFGWTGKIASRNNFRQPKRFIAAVVSLTLSIAVFSAVTVVVSDMRKAVYDSYSDDAVYSDFIVWLPSSPDGDDRNAADTLKLIEESGMFDEPYYTITLFGRWDIPEAIDVYNQKYTFMQVRYLNRKAYNIEFSGHPPISYEELAESGGYLADEQLAVQLGSEKSVTVSFQGKTMIEYTEEEYNALSPEEQKKCGTYTHDGKTAYVYSPMYNVDFGINDKATTESFSDRCLTATADQYENGAYLLFPGSGKYSDIVSCELLDRNDYYNALEFFKENNIDYSDDSAVYRQMLAILASVNIVAVFFSVMIAFIAIVNMVNIIATGILNRRGELAAMQCVGMTEKELRKMTSIECLQYALTSGIAAVVICELMIFLTKKMLELVFEVDEIFLNISCIQPLPIIAIASVCAFIIAAAASVIPLRTMRGTSLVDQIRSVE